MAPASGAISRLMREYKSLQQEKPPHIVVKPDESSFLVWHYVLHDLPEDTPYKGGVYHGKLVFPTEYPFAPPSIFMLTANGRFRTNKRLCFSMSDYHPESWNPSWRIESILTGFISFMLDPSDPKTVGSILSPVMVRRTLALQSFSENKKNEVFAQLFPEFTDERKYDKLYGYRLDENRPARSTATGSGGGSGSRVRVPTKAMGGGERGDFFRKFVERWAPRWRGGCAVGIAAAVGLLSVILIRNRYYGTNQEGAEAGVFRRFFGFAESSITEKAAAPGVG